MTRTAPDAGGHPKAQHSADRRQEMARELSDIKALLQSRALALAQQLAPDGARAGKYWIAKNPTRADRHAGSFWITVAGTAPGAWRDEATGDKGDVIGLVQYITGHDFRRALDWCRDWLGLARLDDDAIRRARAQREHSAAHDAAREARMLADNRRRAFALWLKASERLAATPVETYLRTRGIELDALASPPRAIRFGVRKHLEDGRSWPCMLTTMTGPDNTCWAVHCTFLALDGGGKAPVTPARKIWPSFKGAVMRLARGETGLPADDAAKQGLVDTLCLCEGVEDGLSIAMACPELRVWAAGSLGNLAHVTLPACAGDVVVCADNDWGKPQAARQLEAAIVALSRQGRKVRVARSPVGKDANDCLLSGAAIAHTATAPRGAPDAQWASEGAKQNAYLAASRGA